MRLYDTARRAVVPFEPPPTVRMYVCGITPYDSTHLGHAATYLTYDLLIRRLEELGHEVRYVRNVTDVDDSILPKARELGIPYLELAAAEMARFHGDMDALEQPISDELRRRLSQQLLRCMRGKQHAAAFVMTGDHVARVLGEQPVALRADAERIF